MKTRFSFKYFVNDCSLRFLHPLEDFYIVRDHIDASFLFLLQKDFDIFHILLFEYFLWFFDNSYLSFLYIEKKIQLFYQFFILVFLKLFSSEFPSSEFYLSEFPSSELLFIRIRNFYIINNILRNTFFFDPYLPLKILEDNNFYLFWKQSQSKLLINK